MSDAPRLDPVQPDGEVADRDARIEQLLLLGLDHYFGARYDQAINVWTRVLFLDRGHARVRAYIERARSAQAERQRESLELLHHGVDAFDRGDARAARHLLNSAVDRGAPQEEALALLGRLDRLEAASGRAQPPTNRQLRRSTRRTSGAPAGDRPRPTLAVPLLLLAAGVVVVIAAASVTTSRDRIERWLLADRAGRSAASTVVSAVPVVVPPSSEAALARARMLIGNRPLGQDSILSPDDARVLREALRILDAVRPGDALRADADALRAGIQQALLAAVERASALAAAPRSDRRPGEAR
jgi:hypothetical protein